MTSCSSRWSSPVAAAADHYEDSVSFLSLDSSVFYSETSDGRSPLDFFIINVGGSRYVLSHELLASYPETRLGKLACSSRDLALELCDDADFLENEFFFDRSSQTFQYIMNYYRTGHLHVKEELCVISFEQEIEYWGINELCINPCCRDRYYRHKDLKQSLDVHGDAEVDDIGDEDFSGAACQVLRQYLWDLLEKPESSRAAHTFGTLSIFFVVVSIINMVLISLDLDEDMVTASTISGTIALEYICAVWFTSELTLRFLIVRDKCRFSRRVPNVIDLLAILPFYVTLAVENLHGGNTELENMGHAVQVLRLMRSLRMLKLGRHSTGLKSLAMTITQCYEEVGLLLLFLGVGISLFATTVFALEHDLPGTTFSSVPAAWWWATTSMTTVGYGDIRPDTVPGKVLAFLCILSGILILALPIAIINDRFSACYFTLKIKEAALRQSEVLKRLVRGSVGEVEEGGGVNLRDAYARTVLEMLRLQGRRRVSTRSSGGDELWW